jgi:hypothetical protein
MPRYIETEATIQADLQTLDQIQEKVSRKRTNIADRLHAPTDPSKVRVVSYMTYDEYSNIKAMADHLGLSIASMIRLVMIEVAA